MTALSGIELLFPIHASTVLQALGWRINVATVVSVSLSVF